MMIMNIATKSLHEGMILAGNVYAGQDDLLAKEGDTVTDALIKQLKYFSVSNALVYMEGVQEESAYHAHIKRNAFLITEDDFAKNLREIFNQGGKINVRGLLSVLNETIKAQNEKEKIISCLEEIRETKKELFSHMVSVALLAQLLAGWLGCSEDETKTAALAGLLHDVGLVHFIEAGKKTLVFKEELEGHGYEKHVTDGKHLLRTMKISEPVINAVLSHHERIDGRGYPLRIIGAHINKIGRIVAIADAYDTYTMKQRGEEAKTVLQALHTMEQDGSHKLDSGYVQVFVENMLDAVLMRMVGLSDGSVGRIVMINKYELLYPVVECNGKITDLSVKKRVYVDELL